MAAEQIEQAESEYHALVAAIQLDCQREKQKTREENRMELDHYVESHLEESASEISEKFALILEVDILKIRQQAALQIDAEKTKLQARLQEILRHS